MARAIADAHPGAIEPLVVPRFRLGDVRHVFGAVDAARAELGFEADVAFAEGMREFATAPLRDTGHPARAVGSVPCEVVDTDLREASDAALVVAIARFRQEALAEAYRRHGDTAFGLAVRVLHDHALAEEIVQEVFLRLWNDPERFDPGRGSLRSFLMATVHSRAIDVVRAESSRRAREERHDRMHPQPGYDLEREIVDLTVAEQVREAFEELSDDERRAIELAYSRRAQLPRGGGAARAAGGHGQESYPGGVAPAARLLVESGITSSWTES